MKKIFIAVAVIGFIATVSSSCKKDYTCECTVNGTVQPPATITNTTKSDANKACSDIESTYKINATSATCTLK